jgi:hypothetical protein
MVRPPVLRNINHVEAFVILIAAITCISLHLAVLDTKVCQAKLSRDGGRVRDLSAQCRSTPRWLVRPRLDVTSPSRGV